MMSYILVWIITMALGVHGYFDEEIIQAAQSGDNDKILDFLDKTPDLEVIKLNLGTLLNLACSFNHSDTALLLIEKGANPNFADPNDGETPLIKCSRGNLLQVCVALIEKGANLDATDHTGRTALIYAAERHEDVAKLLIEKGANVNVTDHDTNSPLKVATYYGCANTVKSLVKNEVDINFKDKYLATALAYACLRNNSEIVEILTTHGADVNTADMQGETPLMHAAKSGYLIVLKDLIDNGANINDADKNGNTALHKASFASHEKQSSDYYRIVEILLLNGANIDATNNEGLMALDNARAKGKIHIMDLIRNAESRNKIGRIKHQFELLFHNEKEKLTKQMIDIVTKLIDSKLDRVVNDIKELRDSITVN